MDGPVYNPWSQRGRERASYATICFVASDVGLATVESAIRKSGRASLVVLAVAAIMALAAAVTLCSGATVSGRRTPAGSTWASTCPAEETECKLTVARKKKH